MEQHDPLETLISSLSPLSPEELERRRQGALRLRERLLVLPFYQDKDKRLGMEYWETLYTSQVNS